mgnify:CR=1 FL=1
MNGIEAPELGATFEETEVAPEERPAPKTQERPRSRTGENQGKPKISPVQAGFLIGTAGLFDGAQFIVVSITGLTVFLLPLGIAVGWVVDIFAWLTFFLWLHSLGSGMITKGGLGEGGLGREPFVIIALAFGIEFIPIINVLPAWTAAIVTLIFRERITALASIVGPGGVASALQKTISKAKAGPQTQ